MRPIQGLVNFQIVVWPGEKYNVVIGFHR